MTKEEQRLEEDRRRTANWKRWGPYLADRQWGTVREDYSPNGDAWEYLPHDHARSRAYRWGEDGIGGISDRHQYICFALALWNGRDPILKERLFGLTGNEGNHGEDVKEYYFHLDSTPTHSYMKFLYKYPQREFPYARLVEENRRRGKGELEFELIDTGSLRRQPLLRRVHRIRQGGPEDILIRIEAINRGPEAAPLHLLPTLWFRNTWSWGLDARRPRLRRDAAAEVAAIKLKHYYYGKRWLYCESDPELLFTENETNHTRLFNAENAARLCERRHQRLLGSWSYEQCESRVFGNEGRGALFNAVAARRKLHGSTPFQQSYRRRPVKRSMASSISLWRNAARKRTSSIDRSFHRISAGPAQYHASGVCRSAMEQAVLSLRRRPLAPRRPVRARAAHASVSRPESGMAPSLQCRRASRCRTNGNTRGMPHGISPFIALRLPWWIRISPRSNCC